ncbi:MAG TPA: NAD(P)/FAD-dependent oxidoreductase, partial [Chloroflexota bacterium]
LVDDYLRTSAPDIFAAGDGSEGYDLVRGRALPSPTWGNASEQGRIAAHNMAGRPKPFAGAVTVNTFTFLGFRMATVGITQPEGNFLEVESYRDPSTGDYRKLIRLGDRIVGGIAVGDVRMVGIWRGLIARQGLDAPAASALLGGRTNFAWTHDLGLG